MSENENDFEALRRLLALKRHEVPPPGYFEDFSSQVISRIRAEESVEQLPFLLRFLQWFENRPAYPVAFASSLCLFLLYGIVTVQQNPEMGASWPSSRGFSALTTTPVMPDPNQRLLAVADNTNSPANAQSSDSALFDSQPAGPAYRPQQVGWIQTGN